MSCPGKAMGCGRAAARAMIVGLPIAALLITALPAAAAEGPSGYRWRHEPGRHLALLGERGALWQLNFKKEEGRPYFHPVAATDGTVLTWHQPSDHLWHRALWFSWKLIDGLNYWNEDPKTGKLQGLSDVVDVKVVRTDERGAQVVMRLDYHPPDRPTVLEETRTLTITSPDAEGTYRIDWHQRFTASPRQEVVLDRTPPKEAPWGGYGGLSYRAAQDITDVILTDSQGRLNQQVHGQNARWVDASGIFDTGVFNTATQSAAGVTIFDHPSNPRHPTPWYVSYDTKKGHPFIYTNPALLFNEPLTLPAGESLELYYRVLIHPGRADAEKLGEEFQRFAATSFAVGDQSDDEPDDQPDNKTDDVSDGRPSFWLDVVSGEPLRYANVVDDLAGVRVIYLGESHRLERHHDIQAQIVADLANRGVPLVLGIEQLESFQQPVLDKYNRGEIDFDELAEATEWDRRWSNYRQYRPVLEAARKAGAPVLALNARSETIRQVARGGGIAKLDPEIRKELPDDVQTDDPLYEKLLNIYMMVHISTTPERLRPMVEAQIARDEMMASVLCTFLKSEEGQKRTAVVLCGAGHVEYGLGTPGRVRRRMPGVKDRIVLLSQSGDVELTPEEQAMAREIHVSHEQLRALNRTVADYLHVTSLKPELKGQEK